MVNIPKTHLTTIATGETCAPAVYSADTVYIAGEERTEAVREIVSPEEIERIRESLPDGAKLIVMFGTESCPYCPPFFEKTFKPKAREAITNGSLDIFAHTVSDPVLAYYNIEGVPAILVFEKGGVSIQIPMDRRGDFLRYIQEMDAAPDAEPIRGGETKTQDLITVPFRTSGITRFGIIHSGTAWTGDGIERTQSGVARELGSIWLENGYSYVFILEGVRYAFCYDSRRECMDSDIASLERVVDSIIASGQRAHVSWKDIHVEYVQHGHGGGEGKEHHIGFIPMEQIITTLNRLSPEVQRVIKAVECHGASITTMGFPDANDLLISFAGRNPVTGQTQVNVLDTKDLGCLDPALHGSHQLMVFQGIDYMLTTQPFPARRGFVFKPGLQFVDMGFGEKLAQVFPKGVVQISRDDGVARVLQILEEAPKKGITIVGFDLREEGGPPPQEYIQLAEQFPGTIQFLWLEKTTAQAFLGPSVDYKSLHEPIYSFRFLEGIHNDLYLFPEMEAMLERVMDGYPMDYDQRARGAEFMRTERR